MVYHFFLKENTIKLEVSFNMYMFCIPLKNFKGYEDSEGITMTYHI